MPESPRWLVLRGRREEAQQILARLMSSDDPDDPAVLDALNILTTTITHELETGPASWRDLLSKDRTQTIRRISMGAGLAFMQQACGVNIIANYLPVVLTRSVGLSDRLSLILSAVYSHALTLWATASMLAIDSIGRKPLLLLGAIGQGIAFFMVAVGIRMGTYDMSIFTVVFIFVYNLFFDISFLSIPWLYPAEINSQATRNLGTSISTATNWIFVYVVVLVSPIGIDNLGWKFYLIFGCFNIAFLPFLQLFYVETAKLSLEQIDRLFEIDYQRGNAMGLQKARKQVLLEAEVAGENGDGLVSNALGLKGQPLHLEEI